jgi:transposase, IS5 family
MPMKQSSFAGVGLNGSDFASDRRLTRKARFLIEMNEIVPWRMLRIDFLQLWFNLADEDCEERVPDATTRLKFRRLLEQHALGEAIFARLNALLAERGLKVCGGTMVDATLIAAPSSTKNTHQSRDPEMHHAKKREQREAIKAVAPNAEDFTHERATCDVRRTAH